MTEALKRMFTIPENGEARERYVGTAKEVSGVLLNVALLLATTAAMVLHASLLSWCLCAIVLLCWFLLSRLK